MTKVMTKYEHFHMMKLIARKFSKDEAVMLYKRQLSELQIEHGKLKAELSEYKDLAERKNKPTPPVNQQEHPSKSLMKKLKQENHELRYQLEIHGLLPSKYESTLSKVNQKTK